MVAAIYITITYNVPLYSKRIKSSQLSEKCHSLFSQPLNYQWSVEGRHTSLRYPATNATGNKRQQGAVTNPSTLNTCKPSSRSHFLSTSLPLCQSQLVRDEFEYQSRRRCDTALLSGHCRLSTYILLLRDLRQMGTVLCDCSAGKRLPGI